MYVVDLLKLLGKKEGSTNGFEGKRAEFNDVVIEQEADMDSARNIIRTENKDIWPAMVR